MKRLLNKLGISDKNSFIKFIKQFFKFGIVGLSNTILSLLIYYVLVYLGVHYIVSNIVAYAISVLNAYFWSSKYVFKASGANKAKLLLKLYVCYGLTFALSTGLLFLMVDILGISELVAPIINLCITVPTNFLLNKFWAFK